MKLEKNTSLPIFLSVFLHTMILVIFLGDWNFLKPEEEPYKPRYVTATLVDLKPKAKAAPQQVKEQVLDSKNFEDLKHQKKQEEQRRKEAEAMVQQKKNQEAKAVADKLKAQKLKEEQAKAAKAKAQAEAERKKKLAEEQQRKIEAEKKRKREQEAMEEQRAIQAALQKEEKMISESNDDVNTKSYEEMLIERVEQNWSRPPSARRGLEVVLEINMLPTGVVSGLRVIKSSGDPAFDRSAEQAVRRVDRFTEVKNIPPPIFEQYFRVFRFTFSPEDLRL